MEKINDNGLREVNEMCSQLSDVILSDMIGIPMDEVVSLEDLINDLKNRREQARDKRSVSFNGSDVINELIKVQWVNEPIEIKVKKEESYNCCQIAKLKKEHKEAINKKNEHIKMLAENIEKNAVIHLKMKSIYSSFRRGDLGPFKFIDKIIKLIKECK